MALKATAQITLSSVIDVKATYRYYLLQSSTLTKPAKPSTFPPASTWGDVEPSYVDGSTNSLYFVDCTVFCDDTFNYSEVSLSSSYEAAKSAYNKAVNAQNGVTELTTRVTDAEASITQNATDIQLRATKTEVQTAVTYVDNAKANYGYQYKTTVTLNGDPNLYYPVVFRGGIHAVMREIMVARTVRDLCPEEWNGNVYTNGISITLCLKCNFGEWTDGTKESWHIHDLQEIDGRVFAGSKVCATGICFAIFLRGGGDTGASYRIYSDQPLVSTTFGHTSPQICYNEDRIAWSGGTSEAPTYAWYAPAPRTLTDEVKAEIAAKKYIDVATEAKNAADALDVRVTNSETLIDQNADAIELRAMKNEVVLAPVITNNNTRLVTVDNAPENSIENLVLYGNTDANLVSVGESGEVNVTVCGKNLFDFTQTPYQVTFSANAAGATSTRYGFSISLPAGTYTLHAEEIVPSTTARYMYGTVTKSDGSFQAACHLRVGTANHTRTVTIEDGGILYIYDGTTGNLSAAKTLFSKFNVQIELGSTATAFEPYNGHTVTVATPNGLNSINEQVFDEIDLAQNRLIQRVGVIDSYAGETVTEPYLSSTGSLTTGAKVLYALVEPIVTSLIDGPDAIDVIPFNNAGMFYVISEAPVEVDMAEFASQKYTESQIKIKADEITSQVQSVDDDLRKTESKVSQLEDSISSLVRNENGGTIVQQTPDGLYYLDISDILKDTNSKIEELQLSADELTKRTEYIKSYTDDDDRPCLELGEGDSEFKTRITNMGIEFADTEVPIVTIDTETKSLIAPKISVESELQIGEKLAGKNLLSDDYYDISSHTGKGGRYILDLPPGQYCIWGEFTSGAMVSVILHKSTDGGTQWHADNVGTNGEVGEIVFEGSDAKTVPFTVTGASGEVFGIYTIGLEYVKHLHIDIGLKPAGRNLSGGVWSWQQRSNGNLGLIWKGAAN